MIVVAGTIQIDASKKEGTLAVMKTMQDATQQEDGCITYQFYLNPWDESEVHIFEEWETDEALQAHGQTEHMAAFRAELPNYVTGGRGIKRYVVSEVSDL